MTRAAKQHIVLALVLAACGKPSAPTPAPESARPSESTRQPTRVPFIRPAPAPQQGEEALRAFVPDVALDETGGECSVSRAPRSDVTIVTVVTAYYPTRARPFMSIAVVFDSAGHVARYNERRGIARATVPRGKTTAQIDSAVQEAQSRTRTTYISMNYAIDQAVVTNTGGGKPDISVMSNIRAVERLEKLGPPTATLERIRKLCGV